MAINKISGNILQDDLVRGANLSVQGNLIYFDVTNSRVGVLTSAPQDEFNVIGVANATDVRITSATANGIFYADAANLAVTDSDFTWDGTSLGITGQLVIDNITIDGTGISSSANLTVSTASDGNLTFEVAGNGVTAFDSTTSLGLPVGNTLQRPASPAQGSLRFNTSTGQLEVWDGSNWDTLGSDFAQITTQTITGDGSTVNFTLDESTTASAIFVATNGVVQQPDVAYSVTGNVITFTEAPLSSDTISIRFTAAVTSVSEITNTTGNAAISVLPNAAVSVTGNLIPAANAVYSLGNVTNTWQDLYLTGNISTPSLVVAAVIKTTPVVANSLPSAATVGNGARAFVTDANSNTFANLLVGGGIYSVPVFSNGTNWYVG